MSPTPGQVPSTSVSTPGNASGYYGDSVPAGVGMSSGLEAKLHREQPATTNSVQSDAFSALSVPPDARPSDPLWVAEQIRKTNQ